MKPKAPKQMSFDIPKGAPAVFRQRQLDDNSSMPFGAHKGKKMLDVPMPYLRWFLEQDWAQKWPAVVQYAKRAVGGADQDQERKERE